jgi:hypothetical protein
VRKIVWLQTAHVNVKEPHQRGLRCFSRLTVARAKALHRAADDQSFGTLSTYRQFCKAGQKSGCKKFVMHSPTASALTFCESVLSSIYCPACLSIGLEKNTLRSCTRSGSKRF